MTEKLHEPDFDRHPLNEIEAKLDLLETSWADFLYGARVDRHIRAESRPALKFANLGKVHRVLDHHEQQLVGGNRTAIFTALIYCIQENVPMPYWLGDAILAINEKVRQDPSNLHELFGLKSKLPATGKRAVTARRDVQLQGRLWVAVNKLMAKPTEPKTSKESAIKQSREDLRIPYSQRKCREMFDAQELIQRAIFDAGKRVRKIRVM